MPDTRTHRGPDPRDDQAFGPYAWPSLRQAVAELSWLLERGYASTSALKLVGDRWSLTERQRAAVRRSACADSALARRLLHQVPADRVPGEVVELDGFNVLTTVEAALGGAVILRGRDGCDRDLAGVHGTYRRVGETVPGITLIGEVLASLGAAGARWLLDSPVSNSGRLRGLILAAAAHHKWDWDVQLVMNPDPILAESTAIVATADSAILDRSARWLGLSRLVIDTRVPAARILDFSS